MKFKLLQSITLMLFLSLFIASCSSDNKQHDQDSAITNEDKADSASKTKEKQQQDGQNKHVDMSQFKSKRLDIPYTHSSNPKQTLDIVYPDTTKVKPPYKTILLIHGGGWAILDKRAEEIAPVFLAASQGYAVVSINYRLADEVLWPKPLHDAKAAIRFLRAHALKYHLDTRKILVWGSSAGGHIAEMLAATNHRPKFEDLRMGNARFSSSIQGVVAWYPVSDMTDLTDAATPFADKILGYAARDHKDKARNASPIALVRKYFPPILIVHGTNDSLVPYEQSVRMIKKLKAVAKKNPELITFEGAGHMDGRIRSRENVMNNLNFVDRILFKGKNPYRNQEHLEIKLVK